jgi:RNA polymerase sigma factor (sigma-70 family)
MAALFASSREPFAWLADCIISNASMETDLTCPDDQHAREDEWIAVRCQLGERGAFDELILRWQKPLWTFVRRQVTDREVAKEIAQEVWIRVLRGIGTLRDCSRLRSWLFSIARRTLMDRLRQRYAAPVTVELDSDEVPIEENIDDVEETFATLQEQLTQLPAPEREALTLFYLRELTLEEIADVLLIPVGTVKSRLFRARKMLRLKLDSKGDGS